MKRRLMLAASSPGVQPSRACGLFRSELAVGRSRLL